MYARAEGWFLRPRQSFQIRTLSQLLKPGLVKNMVGPMFRASGQQLVADRHCRRDGHDLGCICRKRTPLPPPYLTSPQRSQ